MDKQKEQKQILTAIEGQKFVRAQIVDNGNAIEIYSISDLKEEPVQITKINGQVEALAIPEGFESKFLEVKVDEISLEDEFLKHNPENKIQERVKQSIVKAKEIGLKNFRRPVIDPSFVDDEDDKTIVFTPGKKPAVKMTAFWWDKALKDFMPTKNSRFGTKIHYDVFLGTIIKYLIEQEQYNVVDAWKAVCDDSRKLGHYLNSENAVREFEPTGSRCVGKWFDLGNTCKILRDDDSEFLLVGGYYNSDSESCPLADLQRDIDPFKRYPDGTGWMILDV